MTSIVFPEAKCSQLDVYGVMMDLGNVPENLYIINRSHHQLLDTQVYSEEVDWPEIKDIGSSQTIRLPGYGHIIKDIHTEIILTSTPTFLEGCHYIRYIINLHRKTKNFNQQLFILWRTRERRLSLNARIGSTLGERIEKNCFVILRDKKMFLTFI